MSVSILATSSFEKELKQLAKKYPSIKKDVAAFVKQLLQQPTMGIPSAMTVTKYGLPSLPKARANPAEQGSLLTYTS